MTGLIKIKFLIIISAAALLTLFSACQTVSLHPQIKTKTIILHCEGDFNSGMRLPVELVFIPFNEKIDTVMKIGPDAWFDSDKRGQWPYRQSLSLAAGEKRRVEVPLKYFKNMIAVVVFADYFALHEPKGQAVVIDAEGAKKENIFVTAGGLLH
jgi:hypothetical protein